MEEKEIKFDIIILSNSTIKYSPFAFGTTFTNIQYLLTEKISKTQKNLEEYFKVYGPIVDYDGNSYVFKTVTSLSNMGEIIYHLNFR